MTRAQSERPLGMERVRRRLEHWRRRRAHPRAPIPDSIWAAAVALTHQHGLYQTARALRINYGALRQHVEAAGQRDRSRSMPTFVELTSPRPRAAAGDYVIELEGPRARLRICVPGLPLRELATLSRTLAGVEA